VSARFSFDCRAASTPLPHFWEHTVGSDHARMALRADWRLQLERAHRELGFRHVRFHGILDDDMGTLIRADGRLLYSFFNADNIMDYLLSIGMRPFVELSFMPTALSSGNATVFRYQGNITPPRDMGQWCALIARLVEHWVERYGVREVRHWFFEVWNEPNLAQFWTGTQQDYFELYRRTAVTIKDVDARLRVGGPATAANAWIRDFVEYCRIANAPLDFVSTHHYPTDAFGAPGDDTATQLSKCGRGVLREQAQAVRQHAGRLPVYYTEWSSSSNPRDPLHDEPFASAFAVKTVLEAAGLVQGYSWWTFSDIFEENFFPAEPFHGGFGLLNVEGVAKPVYRAFELLHGLGDKQLTRKGEHPTVDAWVIRGGDRITTIITNFALPRHPVQNETVEIVLEHCGGPARASMRRIDARHANAVAAWRRMREPQFPSPAQLARLARESEMAEAPLLIRRARGGVSFSVTVPPQGVVAIEFAARDSPAPSGTRGC
jgi:xylan 1,4-beta-xylosidase